MPDLIQKAINGDTEAFLELMDKHSLAMYKVAIGILKMTITRQTPYRIRFLPVLKSSIPYRNRNILEPG